MSTEVRIRRGSAADLAGFTPAQSELIHNLDTHAIHVGDGSTPGGHPITGDTQSIVPDRHFLATAVIPDRITVIRLDGLEAESDGHGGLFTTTDTGVPNPLPSADGKFWFRIKDVGDERLSFDYLRPLKSNYEVTVGPFGDFQTIGAALRHLSSSYPTYRFGGLEATIKLKAGFVMDEQVHLSYGLNMGWVKIIAEDATTIIKRDALTTEVYPDNYAAFAASYHSTLPVISQQFEMDTSGDGTLRHGVMVFANSSATILTQGGVRNAGGNGLFVTQRSSAQANGNVDFTAAGNVGVMALRASSINASFVKAGGAKLYGMLIEDVSEIAARNCVASHSGVHGIYVSRNGRFYGADCVATDCGSGAVAASTEGCGIKVHHAGQASVYRGDFSRASHYGVYGRHAAVVDADTIVAEDCGQYAVFGIYGSRIDADTSKLSRSGSSGVMADEGSDINATNCTIQDAGLDGVSSRRGSHVSLSGGDIRRATESSLRASQCGKVSAYTTDCREAGLYAANATSTGEILASGITYTNGKGVTPAWNTPSANGAVVKGQGTVG